MAVKARDQSELKKPKLEKITVTNKQGLKLVGLLHEGGSKDVVVICHGFRSNKENDLSVNLATALAKEGSSAFRFAFSANVQLHRCACMSDTYPPTVLEFEVVFFASKEVEDLRSVVEYFRGGSHETRAVIGHSKGTSNELAHSFV
ncbi:hypothetical protein MLD38_014280 [Melastoma candidum]|uniref:Uncharacterized protein n=1 Tax=Melastoma candidum TaxID=119954 RepID=A0ACB9RC69_9MYRT|nr:hypothetical protein MLD38_014280 [Melastoma candidum]